MIKKTLYFIAIFVFLFISHCLAEKFQEKQILPDIPETFEYPWQIEFDEKWIVRNTQDSRLVFNIPSGAVIRYCAGEIISLNLEYADNRGLVTFEIIQDKEREEGVRYEVREIQILCD